jgi:hypothetical protein
MASSQSFYSALVPWLKAWSERPGRCMGQCSSLMTIEIVQTFHGKFVLES